jgi:hypothetical protein
MVYAFYLNLKENLRAGGIAQVIECLHSENKALNSNPSTAKKKKERKIKFSAK